MEQFQGNEEDEDEEKALAEAYELNRRLKQMALAGGDDMQAFLQQMDMGAGGEEEEERQRHEQYARQQRQLEMRQQMLAAQMKENPVGGGSDGERGRFERSNAVGGGVVSEDVQREIEQRTLMRANARQGNGGNVRKGGNAMRQKSNYTFDKQEIDRMERDNLKLLNRMYSVRSTGFSFNERHAANQAIVMGGKSKRGPTNGSNAINRRKAQDKIQKENQKMAMRLQSVKGSGLPRPHIKQQAVSASSSGYGANEPFRHPSVVKSQARAKAAKKRQAAPFVQPKEWNDRP